MITTTDIDNTGETLIKKEDIVFFNQSVKLAMGYDFSEYSEKSLIRRMEKLLLDENKSLENICQKIKSDKTYAQKIVNNITVNTTELFRDVKMWQYLKYKVLPKLDERGSLKIWHAGCSMGQEVYSMMILLNEAGLLNRCEILATDINSEVIANAQSGVYKYRFNVGYLDNFDEVIKKNPYNYEEVTEVPYEKYFSINKNADSISMNAFLRNKPTFQKHNMIADNSIYQTFDLILCRNVIIYFNPILQNSVFEMFYNKLKDNGIFILGSHESIIGPLSAKFKKKGLVYIKT